MAFGAYKGMRVFNFHSLPAYRQLAGFIGFGGIIVVLFLFPLLLIGQVGEGNKVEHASAQDYAIPILLMMVPVALAAFAICRYLFAQLQIDDEGGLTVTNWRRQSFRVSAEELSQATVRREQIAFFQGRYRIDVSGKVIRFQSDLVYFEDFTNYLKAVGCQLPSGLGG